MDFSKAPVSEFAVPRTITGGVVWRLNTLKQGRTPFACVDESSNCMLELGETAAAEVRIRFHFRKTSERSVFTDHVYNYLSVWATVLSVGSNAPTAITYSINRLTASLGIEAEIGGKTGTISEALGRPALIQDKLICYSIHDLWNGCKGIETFCNFPDLLGITVKIWYPNDFSQQAQVMRHLKWSASSTDLKLETDDGMILDVHKTILSERSPVLKYFIDTESHKQGFSGVLRMHNCNGKTLQTILHWMYTKELTEIYGADFVDVLKAAENLQLHEILLYRRPIKYDRDAAADDCFISA